LSSPMTADQNFICTNQILLWFQELLGIILMFSNVWNYVEQFEIFIGKITNGGILVYNEDDAEVKREAATNPIRKLAYHTPNYTVSDGVTLLETPKATCQLKFWSA
jgi:UDP-N-acetylmuramate: L-alanyl-gamma-D-glutamyl-meso-diaminopimelate ligase